MKLRCLILGHQFATTGRHGYVIFEVQCSNCGGLYVGHVHHEGQFIKADADSDRIFRDREHLEQNFPALSGDGA